MSLYLDQKYLTLVSNRLPLFKRKSDTLYNCRCILCGDSTKNQRKARGYFFPHNTEFRYKCHNCDASLSFRTFLKRLDNHMYTQYMVEKYTEGAPLTTKTIKHVFDVPDFQKPEERLIDKLLTRLDTLSDDHEVIQFVRKRKIPTHQYKQLYFIDNVKDIVQLNNKYKESIKGEEPRLILPFYDEQGKLIAVTCRGLRGEALKYITVRIDEQAPLFFGINNIDKTKLVYVVEGPIDSLFLNNCVAVGSTSLDRITTTSLTKEQVVLVYDNQPRNNEVCKIFKKSIDNGFQVVIWPQSLQEKDINDMVISGKNVEKIIKENTFQGLSASANFIAWKRC